MNTPNEAENVSNNEPKNHHYVPQHFLKAWANGKGNLVRYRVIPATGKFEVKSVSVRKTASQEHLYRMGFEDGSFEIESTIVTPLVDEEGHKIINLVRGESYSALNNESKRKLAIYITQLIARHPDTIKLMDISSRLEELRAQLKSENNGSDQSVDDVINYFKSSDTLGVMPLAYFLQNESNPVLEKPFSESLMKAHAKEYIFETPVLLCSDYPAANWGNFDDYIFCVLAISPTKAIIYSSHSNIDVFDMVSKNTLIRMINLYSIAKADAAFFIDNTQKVFVEKHLGWAKRHSDLDAQKEYVGKCVTEWESSHQ